MIALINNLRTGKIAYFILMFCFITYLLFINKVILKYVIPENKIVEVDFNEFDSTDMPVIAVNEVDYIGGLLQYIYIDGWAFVDSINDNSNKTISLLFRNCDNDRTYIHEMSSQYRPDIQYVFGKDHSIMGHNHGFSAKIAMFSLPDGIYELYVYDKENEFDYGIISTNRYYNKARNEFSRLKKYVPEKKERIANEKDISGVEIIAVSDGKWNIDKINILENVKTEKGIKNLVQIEGWLSVDQETNDEQNTYVILKDNSGNEKWFQADKKNRKDVVNVFGPKYANTGFEVKIDESNLSGDYSLSLVAEVNGKYYMVFEDIKTVTIE